MIEKERMAHHWPEDQAGTHQSAEEDRVRDSSLGGLEARGVVACPGAAAAPVEEELALDHPERRCLPLCRRTDYWDHGQSGGAGVARGHRGVESSG